MKITGILLISLLCLSCDPISTVDIENKTSNNLVVEIKTIFDEMSNRIDIINGKPERYIPLKSMYLYTVAAPVVIKKNERISVISKPGIDMIRELGYGEMSATENITKAIDDIFTEISVRNHEDNTVLYDKKYFLDIQNRRIDLSKRSIIFVLSE